MKKILKDEKGQVLVESIIAITIGVVALTGVLNLLTNSIGVNRDINQRFTGTYLAMEGLEVTKSLIDKNFAQGVSWNDGLSHGSYEFEYNTTDTSGLQISSDPNDRSSDNLFFNSSEGLYSYDQSGGATETTFKRTIQITSGDQVSTEEMKVRAVVEWEERGGDTREIVVEDHFFNWRP